MLKKHNRLTKRGSFAFVYRKGERKREGLFSIVFVGSKTLKIGFSVSNKLGNAVVRNKLKRRLRAICLKLTEKLKPVQAVVVAAPGAEELEFESLEKTIESLFVKAKLLNCD